MIKSVIVISITFPSKFIFLFYFFDEIFKFIFHKLDITPFDVFLKFYYFFFFRKKEVNQFFEHYLRLVNVGQIASWINHKLIKMQSCERNGLHVQGNNSFLWVISTNNSAPLLEGEQPWMKLFLTLGYAWCFHCKKFHIEPKNLDRASYHCFQLWNGESLSSSRFR